MRGKENESILKGRGLTKLGYVSLAYAGLGPFWYSVWGDKNGGIFFNSDDGLEEWNLQCHGNIYTEEDVRRIDPGILPPPEAPEVKTQKYSAAKPVSKEAKDADALYALMSNMNDAVNQLTTSKNVLVNLLNRAQDARTCLKKTYENLHRYYLESDKQLSQLYGHSPFSDTCDGLFDDDISDCADEAVCTLENLGYDIEASVESFNILCADDDDKIKVLINDMQDAINETNSLLSQLSKLKENNHRKS